jgi:hypothetical protein
MKSKGELTPSVIDRVLLWGKCNLKDKNFKWTKWDANVYDILMNTKSKFYHERYLKTKTK